MELLVTDAFQKRVQGTDNLCMSLQQEVKGVRLTDSDEDVDYAKGE